MKKYKKEDLNWVFDTLSWAQLLYSIGNREERGGGGDGTGTLEKDLLQNTLYKTIDNREEAAERGGKMVKFTLEKDLLQNTLYKTIGTTGKREQRGGGWFRLQESLLQDILYTIS